MRQALTLHPDSRCSAITSIEVDVDRPRGDALLLSYQVTGKIGDLNIPPIVTPARADELWRHTCFEAFVCPLPDEAYYEFNLAPSTQWASYRFHGYRRGMGVVEEIDTPRIEIQRMPERFTLQAALELRALPSGRWRLGLTAVIEAVDGRLSYWALAHPAGKPDFHRADCFTCEI